MSLSLKIADIPSTPTAVEGRVGMGWCAERLSGVYSAAEDHLDVALQASRAADVIDVHGHVHGRFGFHCSRCAEPAELEIDAEFEHHFVGPGQLDAGPEPEAELADEFDADPDVSEHDGVHVELDELCIQHTILALPDVPLCADDCRGLCPQCGINRNREACSCRVQETRHSPWTALAGFKVEPEA